MSLARAECKEWDCKEIRERSVVTYCTFLNEDSLKLVQWFSNGSTQPPVSDFVWNPDNPTIALVQLENKEAVSKIISENGTKISIGKDYRVKLRRGNDLMDFQWTLLLSSLVKVDRHTHLGQVPVPIKSSLSVIRSSSKDQSTNENENTSPCSSPTIRKDSCAADASTSVRRTPLLSHQLASILNKIKVPKEMYNAAENIVVMLQALLQKRFAGCSVHNFRNWNLRIRHDYNDYLLIYVTQLIPPEECNRCLSLPWKSVRRCPQTEIINAILSSDEYSNVVQVPIVDRHVHGIGKRFSFPSGFTFNLITFDGFLVEAQMGRLIRYMCLFDERSMSLLSLVHYWAKSHKIRLHESDELLTNCATYHNIGEPAALEWIVMLFMCLQGLIPTPREIQSCTHRSVAIPGEKVDIGFMDDSDFVATWKQRRTNVNVVSKEEFTLSVVKLAQQFFSLLGCALTSGSWIINTRDEQLISTYELLSKGIPIPDENPYSLDSASFLNEKELDLLQNLHLQGGRGPKSRVFFEDHKNFRILVLNPFNFRWKLSSAVSTDLRSYEENGQNTARVYRNVGKGGKV